mmetsp:Transcript_55476/g.116076  ORF Transcript_55476/g.116076 Transcript_55476/m.116076 type:complete len:103 (-) Transcript_55476:62-370(-)
MGDWKAKVRRRQREGKTKWGGGFQMSASSPRASEWGGNQLDMKNARLPPSFLSVSTPASPDSPPPPPPPPPSPVPLLSPLSPPTLGVRNIVTALVDLFSGGT